MHLSIDISKCVSCITPKSISCPVSCSPACTINLFDVLSNEYLFPLTLSPIIKSCRKSENSQNRASTALYISTIFVFYVFDALNSISNLENHEPNPVLNLP